MVRDGSPQSPKDKRPLSGPNIRTPNLPVTEGVMKTAQQSTRPFNTYPRTDSEGGRSPTGQVGTAARTERQAEGETAALREAIDREKKADRCKLRHWLMDDSSYHLALCSDTVL